MTKWQVSPIDDKDTLRRFLGRDRALTAYALGDIAPPYWEYAHFYGGERNGALQALALIYTGYGVNVFDYFGAPEALPAMRDILLAADPIHYIIQPEAYHTFKSWHEPVKPETMWRMVLRPLRFKPPDMTGIERLTPEDAPALSALHGERVDILDPTIIENGVFCGIRDADGVIIAAAGTHIVAPGEDVAAVGYVYTAPEYRGKGCATRCSAAVVQTLLDMEIGTIILNVAQENTPALKIYERLGFQRYCLLVKGYGVPKTRP